MLLRLLGSCLSVLLLCNIASAQNDADALILRPEARRHGLERQWYLQLEVGGSPNRVESIGYEGGTLFVQTSSGLLHAIDAETGNVFWTSELGSRGGEGFAPAADHSHVAAITGTTLNLLSRETGLPLWTRKTAGVPQSSPGLTDELVVVPTAGGVVEIYPLFDAELATTQFNARGKRVYEPVTTDQSVFMTTDSGHLHALHAVTGDLRFDWVSSSVIYSKPGYIKPYAFVGTDDGFVYAVDEANSATRWQFSAGDVVRKTPVAVGDIVYAMPDGGGAFAIAAQDGVERWFTPRVENFVAASPNRVYFTDRRQQMHVVDFKTGARVDTFFLNENVRPFTNVYTDRIYLVTDSGLLQCLREIGQPEPFVYVAPRVKPAVEDPAVKPTTPAAKPDAPEPEEVPDPAPAAGEDPMPAAEDDPFGGGDDPFGGGM